MEHQNEKHFIKKVELKLEKTEYENFKLLSKIATICKFLSQRFQSFLIMKKQHFLENCFI